MQWHIHWRDPSTKECNSNWLVPHIYDLFEVKTVTMKKRKAQIVKLNT